MTTNRETLGPAERIINSLLSFTDHMVHNRPGIVVPDARTKIGVRWEPVTHKVNDDGTKTVYRLVKVGRKNRQVELGVMDHNDNHVLNKDGDSVGEYRPAGVFPEVAEWFYSQIAEVWKLDNEFAAKWASHAFGEEHRDLKVVLAAFMLVQSRKGAPETDEGGQVLFYDEDFRDVGEAMLLLQRKGFDLNAKMLLRIHDVLTLDKIADINRELGFGRSARNAFLGRWPKAVTKWLRYREENPRMLEGLVKAGFTNTVCDLARRVGYKPLTSKFFHTLRWKQKQANDGRREMAIGDAIQAADSWEGLTETEVCEKIEADKPSWKRLVGLVPKEVGITRAVMSAAIESGALSNKDLVILTPTLEELGLLNVQDVRERWQKAVSAAEDMRAANIARNVKSKEVKEKLEEGADNAAKKAVEEVVKGLRVYFMVDVSGSMQNSIEQAKPLIAKFLQALPPEQVHVATFNTTGREVAIKHPSTKGVEASFRGIRAGGGTNYGAGVRALSQYQLKDDEDALFIFVGDEEARSFAQSVESSGLNPVAFGFLKTVPDGGAAGWRYANGFQASAVRDTAAELGIPCFMIDDQTFTDPYAVPRTIRNLVAATPVTTVTTGRVRTRVTLVDRILKTDLLQKPTWA